MSAIIGAIAGLGSAVAGAISNRKADERANKYAMDAQTLANQRNVEFWNMQNEYNSPTAQLERLRAAGLNPHLLYGGSTSGASGTAAPVQASKASDTRATSQAQQIAQGIAAAQSYADIQVKNAQTDNLRAQNTVILNDALLRQKQAERAGFDLDFEKDVRQSRWKDVEAGARLKDNQQWKTGLEAEIAGINLNVQDATMFNQIERIKDEAQYAKSRLTGENLLNRLKELDIELKELGIMPGDKIYERIIGRAAQRFFKNKNQK